MLKSYIRINKLINIHKNKFFYFSTNNTKPKFSYFNEINKNYVNNLEKIGIITPTHVQIRSIPTLNEQKPGEVVCINSPTGTGKTLAYLLPILSKININLNNNNNNNNNDKEKNIKLLIIAPSRELVVQLQLILIKLLDLENKNNDDINKIINIWLGGNDIKTIIQQFHQAIPSIVIGNPKIIAELMHKDHYISDKLCNVEYVVLDEADTLLKPLSRYAPFKRRKNRIRHPKPSQLITSQILTQGSDARLILVSAVINSPMRGLIHEAGWSIKPNVLRIQLNNQLLIPPSIEHQCIIRNKMKIIGTVKSLIKRFSKDNSRLLLVVPKETKIKYWVDHIKKTKCSFAVLHEHLDNYNDMYQKFENGDIQVIICTDAVAHGLDFPFLTHVILPFTPRKPSEYIHIAGRVGRYNKNLSHNSGKVISILSYSSAYHLYKNSKFLNIHIDGLEQFVNDESLKKDNNNDNDNDDDENHHHDRHERNDFYL